MQGFNMGRYVPPDLEGTTSANKASGKGHALGSRASKLASQGVLMVRFEMPFPVWCAQCPKPTLIGQGVRFNAEKKRVGSYLSSTIFSFRMKHSACGGAIEIRTDPKNTAYEVVAGGKKQDRGEDKVRSGDEGLVIMTGQEREVLRTNAFAKLEKTIEDREQLVLAKARIEELHEQIDRLWENPYEQNRRVRNEFRVGRHAREKNAKITGDLQERMSLGIDLLPVNEDDARRAKLIDFGPTREDGEEALAKPLFMLDSETTKIQSYPAKKKKGLKSEVAASQMRENLVSEIVGNTRVALDPFLGHGLIAKKHKPVTRMSGIKRRKLDGGCQEESDGDLGKSTTVEELSKGMTASTALVQYDSNSE